MELCTSLAISNLSQKRLFAPSSSPLGFTASLPPKKTTISYRNSGLLNFSSPLLRATTSEETSTRIDGKSREESDGVITMEETPANGIRGPYEGMPSEESKEAPTGEQMQIFELLDKLNLDSEDTSPLLLYGSGALVVLWLTSALVGAVDSIPLFPKLLEVVGLGYTIWFSYRYLIFKKNREELFAKIEELKQEILGSTRD
ncbi:protein CURVATURE THYLAKOID 1D, chloroplastic-like isoform X2 [Telopea speciosissima]|uniref:protein CURVATURE THYLAKOID 1D, chloroplastic-like isoform X2 n=1 Tax=Telopea speciosissima TaxID=54955 RepID=UPI001CC4D243|nr:protein CURVATURE THYLAKOID 1D, chloroplastic-like isoform X2 [Telopea speciosissima]